MKTIKITIELGPDNYGAYAENVENIVGAGDTIAEAKKSILECIEIVKEFPKDQVPEALKGDYEIIYKMDVKSLLEYYGGIFSRASLERITGISQKLLSNYAQGVKKPSQTQAKKIEYGLHKLASELMAVEL
jgi:predicted RNase H-like HicB family nuclease